MYEELRDIQGYIPSSFHRYALKCGLLNPGENIPPDRQFERAVVSILEGSHYLHCIEFKVLC